MPEEVLLAVGLDERDPPFVTARQAQVAERLVVDREEPARRAVLGRHVSDRRAIGERQPGEALAEVLDELPDDAGAAQDLGDREDEVGRGRPLGELPVEPEADDLRHEHRDRLAEHRGLGLDPPDAPAEDAEPVDHRRVRVRADKRVGERAPAARLDDAREVLEVDLVADAGVRRHDLQRVERALTPPEECVALAVSLELELRVARDREAARKVVHLDRVVDHELGRDQWVDAARVAAEIGHRVAHRGEVDDRRHAGEVLEKHPRGREGHLVGRLGRCVPARDRLDVGRRDGLAVLPAQDVLEEDPQRVRQARDVVVFLKGVEPEDLVLGVGDGQGAACAEAVGMRHGSILRVGDWQVALMARG